MFPGSILKSSDNSYQQVIHNLMWITFLLFITCG
nr:MAG TPA: Ribosome associated membrane protein RAMP4 [Caudoviricetes sp.]